MGSDRVSAGTPGAKKVKEKSDHWYIVYKVAGKVKRIKAYTDKATSEAMLTDWNKARERGDAGLTDPYKAHLNRPLSEHVTDYLEDVRHGGTSPRTTRPSRPGSTGCSPASRRRRCGTSPPTT
jgi:hypothetical protein